MKVVQMAYEAGPTGFGLARALEAAGLPVLVVAPSRVVRPVSSGAKTDRLDCLKLAEYAMRGMLKPIAIPSETEEAERSLVRRRHRVVDEVRRTKQRIKSLLLQFGCPEPRGLKNWSHKAVVELKELELPSVTGLTLASLIRELEWHQLELRQLDGHIDEVLSAEKHQEEVACLRSVPGVGPGVARAFRLELYRPDRFRRAEEVASYLGLAPMVRHSGQGKAQGRIRPVGQKRLRSLLIEAAWVWKSKDDYAAAWYGKLLSRHGLPQKAITALARKLAIILWRLSLEKRPYRPKEIVA